MSHELNFENGRAQMFSVKETPWHQEGVVLTDHPSYDDALKHANFDYPLEKRPHFRVLPDGVQVEADDSFYVYRSDKNAILGSVGSSYEVVSNREAFEPLRPLVDAGLLRLETGGVLRDGADAWLLGQWDLARFGPTAKEVLGDQIGAFATVCANHSGRRGILLGNTPIRIVCANTLGAAETSGVSRWETVDHKRGAKIRLVEAAQRIFSGVVERYEVVAKQYKLLMSTALAADQFAALVLDVLAPLPTSDPKFNPEAKLAKVVMDRAAAKREEVKRLWVGGKGHTGEHNAWFAYNAAVEALDYNRELWPTRAGAWRTASLLDGTLAKMKNAVLDNLVQYAQSC